MDLFWNDPIHPEMPYFIILLCLMPDDFIHQEDSAATQSAADDFIHQEESAATQSVNQTDLPMHPLKWQCTLRHPTL
jgi:hypothetical protein